MMLSFSKIDWDEVPTIRERIYFAIALLMIAICMMRLFWLPTAKVIEVKKTDIKNIKLQISTLEKFINMDAKIARPTRTGTTYNVASEDLKRRLKRMSGDSREVIAEVVNEITSSKLMGKVVLNSLSFETTVARSGYTQVPVSLSVTGTFPALNNYLTALERLDYLYTIDNIKITLSSDRPGLINADLRASIYISGSGEPNDKNGGKG